MKTLLYRHVIAGVLILALAAGKAAAAGGSGVLVTNNSSRLANPLPGSRLLNLAVGDVDGNGSLDIVAPVWRSTQVLIYSNHSSGTFTATTHVAPTGALYDVALSDLDTNGSPDFVFGCFTQTLVTARNDGSGTPVNFTTAYTGGVATALRRVSAVEINADSLPDAVAISESDGTIRVFTNAAGHLVFSSSVGAGRPLYGLATGDVDGDGRADAVAVGQAGLVALATNSALGRLTAGATWELTPQNLYASRLADLDQDGHVDVIVAGAEGFLAIGYGEGGGTFAFTTVTQNLIAVTLYGLAVGDIDDNGRPDILICGGDKVAVLVNSGSRVLLPAPAAVTLAGEDLRDLEVGDLNGDGSLDATVCGFAAGSLYVLWNSPASQPEVLGVNNQVVASNESPSLDKGTDFGAVAALSVVTNRFKLANRGSGNLLVIDAAISGVSTSILNVIGMPAEVAPGATGEFRVVFAPVAVTNYTGTLTIQNNGPATSSTTPYVIRLAGAGSKRSMTSITLSDTNHVYDGTAKEVKVSVAPDVATMTTYNGNLGAPTNAGVYTVVVVVVDDVDYQGAVTGLLTIAQRDLTLTCDDKVRGYGENNPAFTLRIDNFAPEEDEHILTARPSVFCAADAFSPTGRYAIVVSGGAAPNYHLIYVNGTLVVTQVLLTVTAENQSRLYGQTNPVLTLAYSGWKNGETPAVLTALPIATTAADANSPVGGYPITVSGGAAVNYAFQCLPGTLTVYGAPATVNIAGLAHVYNGTPKTAIVTTVPPGLTYAVTYDGLAALPVNAGSYAVWAGVTDPNYSGTNTATLVIAKAGQTILSFQPPSGPYSSSELLTLAAQGSASGIPLEYAVVSGPGVLATPGQLRFTGYGNVAVAAWQPGDANWLASAVVTNIYWAVDTNLVHYAAQAGQTPRWPYETLPTAASNIQQAVDTAQAGELILVGAGTYLEGARAAAGHVLANRLVLDKAVTVRSISGAAATFIAGRPGTGASAPLGADAVRCAFLTNGAALHGVTLTNGFTLAGGTAVADLSGGGALLSPDSALVDCVVAKCGAVYGGGARGGAISRCLLVGNSAQLDGGGVHSTELFDSVVRNGSARYGGGGFRGTLRNCTLRDNSALYGGGLYEGVVRNGIVWGNTGRDLYGSDAQYTCAAQGVAHGISGCITNNPLFADTGVGGVYLLHDSPAINSGDNAAVPPPPALGSSIDIEGRARILHGRVDLGAHEYDGMPAVPVVAAATDISAYAFLAHWNASIGTVTVRNYALAVTNTAAASQDTFLADGAATSLNVTGRVPGTRYRYRVQARNEFTNSDWSAWADVVTLTEAAIEVPSPLAFAATYGGADPAPQSFLLANHGETTAAWSSTLAYGVGSGWLSLSTAAGAVAAQSSVTVTARIAIAGLNAGFYTATNRVSSPTATNTPRIQVVTLALARGADSIVISNTNHVYSGTGKAATGASASGSPVSLTYNGMAALPVNAGVYAVTGVVDALNWAGTNTAALTIRSADQAISAFAPASGVYGSSNILALSAVGGGSGQAVIFTVLSGPGVLLDGNRLRFTGLGVVEVRATQGGNANWNAAPPVTRTYTVTPVANLVHYVSLAGQTPIWPFSQWDTAAATIQDAIDASAPGDTVIVGPGRHDAGGRAAPGALLSNRACVDRAIALCSSEGPTVTTIAGAASDGGGCGVGAMRCAWLGAGSVLEGFTLSGGFTRLDADLLLDQSGGGVLLESGAEIKRCIVIANGAAESGGGACLVEGGNVVNCLIRANQASFGGGVHLAGGGWVRSSTVSGNTAMSHGGGICLFAGGDALNVIAHANTAMGGGADVWFQGFGGSCRYVCAADGVTAGVNGCITNAPRFVNQAAGDYRLQPSSPCFDAGVEEEWMTGSTDLDGRSRVLCATVDLGAYEQARAWLACNEPTFAWSVVEGQTVTNDSLQVWNAGEGGTLTYEIATGDAWLTAQPVSGTSTGEHDVVRLIASAQGLLPGVYTTQVAIVVDVAAGGTRKIHARLQVNPLPVDLIVDDADASGVTRTGVWYFNTSASAFRGRYLDDGRENRGAKSVAFTPRLPVSGEYNVYIWYPVSSTFADDTPVDVRHASGTNTFIVNQTINGGQWVLLGRRFFQDGTNGWVRVRNGVSGGLFNNYVIADAVRFERVAPIAPQLATWPTNLVVVCQQGGNPSPQTLGIWNCGAGSLTYAVTGNVPWVSLSPSAGASTGETDRVFMTFAAGSMATGRYDGIITVSATGANGAPRRIPIALTIAAPPLAPAQAVAVAHCCMEPDAWFVLRWPSTAGRTYSVARTRNLGQDFQVLTNGLPAMPPENTFRDNCSGIDRAFYRVTEP